MTAALIGAAATILAAIIPLAVVLWRTRTTVNETSHTVDVVHHLVNSQRDEQLRYQAELSALIRALGGIVPDQDPPSGAP